MSYNDIADMVESGRLTRRIVSCAWQENAADPGVWVYSNIGHLVSHTDWETAWASARVADNTDPGGDESVITDAMILSSVQAQLGTP